MQITQQPVQISRPLASLAQCTLGQSALEQLLSPGATPRLTAKPGKGYKLALSGTPGVIDREGRRVVSLKRKVHRTNISVSHQHQLLHILKCNFLDLYMFTNMCAVSGDFT
jgi:hypothetical protein